jgi:hypothetical protein
VGHSASWLSRHRLREHACAAAVAAEVGNTFGGAAVLAGGVWALFNLDSDEPKAPPSLPSPKTEDDDTEE